MMVFEKSETPEQQWSKAGMIDLAAALSGALPSPEGRGDDSVLPAAVLGAQTQDVRPHSDSNGLFTEDEDAEDETQTAVSDWLARVCPATGEREKDTPEEVTEECTLEAVMEEYAPEAVAEEYAPEAVTEAAYGETCSETDFVHPAPEEKYPDDEFLPVQHPVYTAESGDNARAVRDAAAFGAHQLSARHSCHNRFGFARQTLWLALLAVTASFALQIGSSAAPKVTFALSLVLLVCGLRWAVDFLSVTKELSQEYPSGSRTRDE